MVDDHRADREKKGKYFDFSRKVGNFETGCFEAKEVKQGVAGDLKFLKDFATPRAVCKVFDGVFSLIAKGARDAIMTDINASVSHSPAGWPTIEESFDIDTMSRRLHLSTKAFKPIDGSGNRMSKRNAESKTLKSTPNLVDEFSSSFALCCLINNFQDTFLQRLLFQRSFLKPLIRLHRVFLKVSVHSTFGKNKVHNEGVAVPV